MPAEFLSTLSFHDILATNYLSFDLQRFASAEDEGRTEEPSESKKRKAREEGNVPQSQELTAIASFMAIYFTIAFLAKQIYSNFYQLMVFYLEGIDTIRFTKNDMQGMSFNFLMLILNFLWPIFAVALVVGIGVTLAQTRFLFTAKKIKPDFKKVFGQAFSNLKKMFWSKQSFFNLGKSLAKVAIVFGIAFIFMMNELGTMISYIHMDSNTAIGSIFKIITDFVLITGIILLVISIADYIFQYREYIESIKMTKQEVKDEFKEQEGNPEIKQKIRQLGRQMGSRKMMNDVPSADIVITNPTHYAVALKYDASYMSAPIVIAKGVDRTALKIREIATEYHVPIHENKPLARGLYAAVDIGDEIPAEFYVAVSELLKLVYDQNNTLAQHIPII